MKQFGKVMETLVGTGHFKSKEAGEAKDQYEKLLENKSQNTKKSLLILIYLGTNLIILLYHFCLQRR